MIDDITKENFLKEEKNMISMVESIQRILKKKEIKIIDIVKRSNLKFEEAKATIDTLIIYGFATPVEQNENKFKLSVNKEDRKENLKNQILVYDRMIDAYKAKKLLVERLETFTNIK